MKKEDEIYVYENGERVGTVPLSKVVWTDRWGGARIGQEWQEGEVEYDGRVVPIMCDGDETYAVLDYVEVKEE